MNDPQMTDTEMDHVMRTWMEEPPAGQPDRSRVVGSVVSRLGSTRRRRRRRWPLSLNRARATTSQAPDSHDGQVDAISPVDSHVPSVTGRTRIMFSPAKASLVGALVFAIGGTLLVAQPFQRDASVPGAETTAVYQGALATGHRSFMSETDFVESTATSNGFVQRGRTTMASSEMSDPRLSGDVVIQDNADRWTEGTPPDANVIADLLWGTIEISNDGGTWTGAMIGTTDTTADGLGISYYELAGSGGYEGLSAVLFEREESLGRFIWNGVVFPGDLPPDRQ
jgi:hypothetical protein